MFITDTALLNFKYFLMYTFKIFEIKCMPYEFNYALSEELTIRSVELCLTYCMYVYNTYLSILY